MPAQPRCDDARMTWRSVARASSLASGDVIGVEVDGVAIALGRDGDRYFATQRQCVHRGGDLSEGIVSRGHLICPNHGWRFSTETGQHADASEYCLIRYPVRVTGDEIEVDSVPIERKSQ